LSTTYGTSSFVKVGLKQTKPTSLKRTRAIDENEEIALFRRVRMKTSITPPNIDSKDGHEVEVNADMSLHCYCNGGGQGQMIACCSLTCEKKWFHMNCVGLTVAPSRCEFFLSIMLFHLIAIAPVC
jgi:hypothetical protein